MEERTHLTAVVSGHVQGVGFRWAVERFATEHGLSGWARNLPNGSVEIVVEGNAVDTQSLARWLESDEPPGHVSQIEVVSRLSREPSLSGFHIR